MALTFAFQDYYFNFKLSNLTEEKEGIAKFQYVCQTCKQNQFGKFCLTCNKVVDTERSYYQGSEEQKQTGSADVWGFERNEFVNLIRDLPLVSNNGWKLVETSIPKKPKASEVQKFREQTAKLGTSRGLDALQQDLATSGTIIKADIVQKEGKINKIYFASLWGKLLGVVIDTNKMLDSEKLKSEQLYDIVVVNREEKPIEA